MKGAFEFTSEARRLLLKKVKKERLRYAYQADVFHDMTFEAAHQCQGWKSLGNGGFMAVPTSSGGQG